MTTSQITVRGVEELIATVPLQMGYQPEDSLVLVLLGPPGAQGHSLRAVGKVLLMARIDLPHEVGAYEEVLIQVNRALRQQRPAMLDVLAYEDDEDASGVLQAVARMCREEDVGVHHLVRVRDGRWQQLEPESRAPDGTGSHGGVAEDSACNGTEPNDTESVWCPVPPVDRVPCAADLVLAGARIGPSRAELAQWIRQGQTERKLQLLDEVEDYLDRFLASVGPDATGPDADDELARVQTRFIERGALAWRRILDVTPGGPEVADLPPAVLAHALVMLWHREFRDGVITWIAPGAMGPGLLPGDICDPLVRHLELARTGNRALLDRLVALCALVPDEFAPPVLTVTAQGAWALNSGTVANLAIERALELDPDYYLAQLTDLLLQNAVPPPPGPFVAHGAPSAR